MPEQSFTPKGEERTPIKKPIAQELFEALITPNNQRTLETRQLQVKILRTISEDIVEQAYSHLYSDYLAQEKIHQEKTERAVQRGLPPPERKPYNDLIVMEGYLNEVFAITQIEQNRPELITSETDTERRKSIKAIGEKLLDVAHQPDRFNLQWGIDRNPDTAWLNLTDDNRIIIEGAGEITAGKLNKRKYLQLGDSGYGHSLKRLCHNLNTMSDTLGHGLGEFGVDGIKVDVSPTFKQYVVLGRDVDTSHEGLSANIGPVLSDAEYAKISDDEKKKVFSQTEHDSFLARLTNETKTEIIKSAFTGKEAIAMAKVILEKIKQKYPSYASSQV